ncbi:MATE family efflux transporter [Anaerotruncus rubiinfantis]|nr:MATE family efflux transporter [Anaerotruncus rubiinfantis]
MQSDQTADEKFLRMTQTPIPQLVCTLAVPTIISMLITSIYNMADTFFVGRISTTATGAVGVVFSLMAVIQALGFLFGQGSGNYISRKLGEQEFEEASRMAATGFFSALIAGGAMALLGEIFLDQLVTMLGATPTILPLARDYAKYILLGAPYMVASLVLNNQLRFQGSAMNAMVGITAGGVLNVALDPLFIFVFDMGVGGAALATVISQFVSFCILLYGCTRGGNLRIHWKMVTFKWHFFSEILRGGMPSLWRQGLASVAAIFLNHAAGAYGDAAIAAMSIVSRVNMFASSALIGFGQGFQPVCGFNYGAKYYNRVREAFWFCMRAAVGVLVCIAAAGFIFAPQVIALFRGEDAQVVAVGALALRLQCITFPLMSWVILNNMMTQTIGQSGRATLLSVSRQGLFFVPAVLILPPVAGVLGIQMAQPVSDVFCFALSVVIGIRVLRELREAQEGGADA